MNRAGLFMKDLARTNTHTERERERERERESLSSDVLLLIMK